MTPKRKAMHSKTPGIYGPIEEVHAGVDWLSCTLDINARESWAWGNECVAVLADIADEGNAAGPFGLNGYRGIKVAGSFTGRREDSLYCQLSGRHAQDYMHRIERPDLHISRLDLAVTVRFKTMPSQLGEDAHRDSIKSVESSPLGRRRKIWYMSGNDGGYTLYIGSQASEQRGRLYNKEVQSETPEYARCWRYETVYRNDRAMAVFEELLAVAELYRPTLCGLLVGTWYQDRGVTCPWMSIDSQAIRPIHKEIPSDAAKKLQWLEKQVRPAVRWLQEKGLLDQALQALGIGE